MPVSPGLKIEQCALLRTKIGHNWCPLYCTSSPHHGDGSPRELVSGRTRSRSFLLDACQQPRSLPRSPTQHRSRRSSAPIEKPSSSSPLTGKPFAPSPAAIITAYHADWMPRSRPRMEASMCASLSNSIPPPSGHNGSSESLSSRSLVALGRRSKAKYARFGQQYYSCLAFRRH